MLQILGQPLGDELLAWSDLHVVGEIPLHTWKRATITRDIHPHMYNIFY